MKKTPKILLAAVVSAAALLSCVTALIFIAGARGDDRDVETVTAKINYYFYDEDAEDHKGHSPYNSFVANMPKGSADITERCPIISGYTPERYVEGEGFVESETVTLSFSGNSETDIFYYPSNTEYQIKLMKQNLYDNAYTLGDIIYSRGMTGTKPAEFDSSYRFPDDYSIEQYRGKALSEVFEGFTMIYYEPEEIAASGETIFSCYFDRNYYNIDFDLGSGGYGVSPMYVPYGYPLEENVDIPSRAGFTFDGWEPALSEEVTGGKTFTAKWKAKEAVSCSVVFKTSDAGTGDNPTYSYWGDISIENIAAGSVLSLDDIIDEYSVRFSEFCPEDAPQEYRYFEFDETATRADNPAEITVSGDNSTVITLLYARKKYTVRFAYARQDLDDFVYLGTSAIDLQNSGYYLVSNRAKDYNFVQGNVITKKLSNEYLTGLEMVKRADTESPVRWYFDKIQGQENAYYVYSVNADGKREYLYIGVDEEGNAVGRGMAGARVYADNEEKPVTIVSPGTKTDTFTLYQTVDGTDWYLNDMKNNKGIASASNSAADDGSQWRLCPKSEMERKPGKIRITNRTTGSGLNENYGSYSFTGSVSWDVEVTELPKLTLADDPNVKYCYFDKEFEHVQDDGSLKYYHYRYHCISLTAEYGADIEDIWPADPLDDCTRKGNGKIYKFGSWASDALSVYRYVHGSTHSNIIGSYPTMSTELMIDFEHHDVEVTYDSEGNEMGQTLYAWWGDDTANIGPHAFDIYYEAMDQQEIDEADPADVDVKDGITFIRQYSRIVPCAHNKATKVLPFVYEGVQIIASEAEGYLESHDIAGHYNDRRTIIEDGEPVEVDVVVTPFHYLRKKNDILFESMGTALYSDNESYKSVPYGKSLADLTPEDPPYPSESLEAGTYSFGGWYTSGQLFDDDHLFDFSTAVMPERTLKLYAYWKPVTFELAFYNDEEDYTNGGPLLTGNKFSCRYGEFMSSEDIEAVEAALRGDEFLLPDGVTTAKMDKVGWYYYKDGRLTSFVPETMTVGGSMELFMEWTTTVPAEFKVTYGLKDSDTVVADETNGYSFVGLTRSFKTKTGSELYDDYSSNYYPYRRSQSIMLKSDPADNTLHFDYGYRNAVPYRVRYVEVKADGSEVGELADAKTVYNNTEPTVTEKFIPINGYLPQNSYKSLVLAISDEYGDGVLDPGNVMTFTYIRDELNVPCHVEYLTEDPNGTESCVIGGKTVKFSSVSSIEDIAQRGAEENGKLLAITGYTPAVYEIYDEAVENGEAVSVLRGELNAVAEGQTSINYTVSDSLEICGSELRIYYTINSYPVKVSYSLSSDDPDAAAFWYSRMMEADSTLIGDPDSAEEYNGSTIYTTVYKFSEPVTFESTFEAEAPEIDKFRVSGDNKQAVVIADDDTEAPQINKISFVYKEIPYVMYQYFAVLPSGFDTVIPPADDPKLLTFNMKMVEKHTVPDHTVTARLTCSPYRFVGWFTDEECTVPVDAADLAGDSGEILSHTEKAVENLSFYAKYELISGTLKISASADKETDTELEYIIKGEDTHNSHIKLTVFVPVNGTVTINSLPIGNYTVAQGAWSWRYTPAQNSQEVTITESGIVTTEFSNSLTDAKWLAN